MSVNPLQGLHMHRTLQLHKTNMTKIIRKNSNISGTVYVNALERTYLKVPTIVSILYYFLDIK